MLLCASSFKVKSIILKFIHRNMKHIHYIATIALCLLVTSCSTPRSSALGVTETEISTITHSVNEYDLDVDPQGIVYTIDISTQEGRIKLNKLSLKDAQELALQEAAIKNNCARIISPKFSYLKKGKKILRMTVFGFPARYKNSSLEKKLPTENNVIIVK